MAARLPRVLLCLDHPAQHFAAAFRCAAMSNHMAMSVLYWRHVDAEQYDPGFDRRVLWDADLMSGYESEQARGASLSARAVSVVGALHSFSPDVVVVYGWATTIARIAILWSFIRRKQVLFYGDSTWQHSTNPRLRLVRGVILRWLFSRAAGALSTGTFNREFYISYGMHPAKVFDGVCPVDVAAFAAARRDEPTDDELVVGFAGKLTTRKGADELLRALAELPPVVRWRARIVGDGPQRQELEELAVALGIVSLVEFLGFRNTSSMPAQLAACDVVVVPSRRDLRVLVTAEAMAAGAAIVVSSNTAVWGRGDLVEDGISGRVYRSGVPSDLARVLIELAQDRNLLQRLQRAGAARATEYGPSTFASRLEQAVDATIAPSRP